VWFNPCRNDEFKAHFVSNGVDRDFIRKALTVPPEQMWFPTTKELLDAHVITQTTALPAAIRESVFTAGSRTAGTLHTH
jgi:hypothetical protein